MSHQAKYKSKQRRASLASVSLAAFAGAAAATGCYGGGSDSRVGESGDSGSVDLALQLGGGQTLGTVNYSITGPGAFSKIGTIDVSTSPKLSGIISPVPQGTGYAVFLSATAQGGTATCTGSAPFDVTAKQITHVDVHVTCIEGARTGSILVNGALNICPTGGIAGLPRDLRVGKSAELFPVENDFDGKPSPLTHHWRASNGGLSSENTARPTFTCLEEGLEMVMLTLSDGDPACDTTYTSRVNCFIPLPDGGLDGGETLDGAVGTGGTTGSGGLPSTGGAANAGGAAETGGTANTGGTPETGGVASTGGSDGGVAPSATNLVVYRIGTGAAALTGNATAVFLDEFTPAGALVHSTPAPTVLTGGNHAVVASGVATSEGLITRSADGKFVVFAGYDAPPGTASIAGTTSASVPRVIGLLDASGTLNTMTALTDAATGSNPRSVASTDGLDLWLAGGAGGVRYATRGGTTSVQLSTTVTNLRQLNVFDGQLYTSTASGTAVRLGAVGTGLPKTAGQVITNAPGLASSGGSPYGFFFADVNPAVPGVDVLYIADDAAAALTKYSLVGGSWTSNGTVGTSADAYRSVTGIVTGTKVQLYATRKGGSSGTGGGELVSIADDAGYGGAFVATPAVVATAAVNTVFRGVALAPAP